LHAPASDPIIEDPKGLAGLIRSIVLELTFSFPIVEAQQIELELRSEPRKTV
jgi:hypothetical protein